MEMETGKIPEEVCEEGRGVVGVVMTPDRRILVLGGSNGDEDNDKYEWVRKGGFGRVEGRWFFPGGALQKGENILAALLRELKGETRTEGKKFLPEEEVKERLSWIGRGFLAQHRGGKRVDFLFDVFLIRLTWEEIEEVVQALEEGNVPFEFFHLTQDELERLRDRLRPRDQYVLEMLVENKT